MHPLFVELLDLSIKYGKLVVEYKLSQMIGQEGLESISSFRKLMLEYEELDLKTPKLVLKQGQEGRKRVSN